MTDLNRRQFVAASGAALAVSVGSVAAAQTGQPSNKPASAPKVAAEGDNHRGPCLIGSANGIRSTGRAADLIAGGTYVLDAIVDGIKIVEDDPKDMSVGYGGLPNEEGVVQLDASCMDGPTHRAGSVGAIENIKNPAAVALLVMRRTDHVMLVGAGALKFAKQMGFKEEDLLTEEARQEWLKWKSNLNKEDWWLDDDQQGKPAPAGLQRSDASGEMIGPDGRVRPDGPVKHTWGTIHLSGLDARGNMGACTSTSGLSWKLPGRLGDSPIVGAGMYCDNAIGSAGATGRGESVIQVCGAFSAVQYMEAGLTPTEACLAVLKKIVDKTKIKRLLDAEGRPLFDVTMYALRKDGAYGSASIHEGAGKKFAVHDGQSNRLADCAYLYEKDR